MTRRLVMHLGDHKTGSTSIQQALASGRIEAKQSLLFPVGQPRLPHHNHVARALIRKGKGRKPRKRERKVFKAMAAEIDASDADIAVVSAENFEFARPDELMKSLEKHLPGYIEEMRLIAYIRPHGERLLSSYAERIKQGLFLGDLAAFHAETLEEGEFTYAPRLAQWREVFGDRFIARPFLRDRLRGGDVVQDVLDWVFEGQPFTAPQLAESNEKLSVEDLALLREIQHRLQDIRGLKSAPREPVRALGWRLARMLSAVDEGRGTALALDRALAADIVTVYAEDAAETDAAFFEGTPLTDALGRLEGRAVEAPQSVVLKDVLSPASYRIASVWITLIHDLFQHRPEEWRPFFQASPLRTEALSLDEGRNALFADFEAELDAVEAEAAASPSTP